MRQQYAVGGSHAWELGDWLQISSDTSVSSLGLSFLACKMGEGQT